MFQMIVVLMCRDIKVKESEEKADSDDSEHAK